MNITVTIVALLEAAAIGALIGLEREVVLNKISLKIHNLPVIF